MSFMDTLKAASNLDGGAGGYIAKVLVEMGFKIFVSGLSNADSFFAYVPTDKASVEKALSAAKQAQAAGSKEPKPSFQLTIYKASVKGREVAWTQDRVFTTQTWTPAYKQVIEPELMRLAKEGKLTQLGEYWGRVTFKPDPTGRMQDNYKFVADAPENDANKRQVPELVAYLAEIYQNEAQATQAASGEVVASNGHVQESVWTTLQGDADFAMALKEAGDAVKPTPKKLLAVKETAKEWGLNDDEVNENLAALKAWAGI